MDPADATETPAAAPSPSQPAGRTKVAPRLLAFDRLRSGSKPSETRRTEPDSTPAALFGDGPSLRDHDKAPAFEGPPPTGSRTASLDDTRSIGSSAPSSSLGTALESVFSATGTYATFVDEPLRLVDVGDAAPTRRSTLPLKDDGPGGSFRSDSVDSDASFAPPVPPRNLRAQYHCTFPLHPWIAQRQPSFDQPAAPHQPSALREIRYPSPSPPSPVLERDSGFVAKSEGSASMRKQRTDSTGDEMGEPGKPTPQGSVDGDSDGDISLPDFPQAGAVVVEPRPDEAVIEEICERFLSLGFETELSEFDGRTQVWEIVKRCWHELYAVVNAEGHDGGSPVDGREAHSSGPSSVSGVGGAGGGENRKRTNQQSQEAGGGPGDGGLGGRDGGNGDEKRPRNWPPGPRKTKLDGSAIQLSCPFRKRNPLRFNIRDHVTCATQYFADMYSLKRHVKNFHKLKSDPNGRIRCLRCGEAMPSQGALMDHLSVPLESMCHPLVGTGPPGPESDDPEDGISDFTEALLNNRKNNSKVDTWKTLWQTLFQDRDTEIPSSCFDPPVELYEVEDRFQNNSTVLANRLEEEFGTAQFGQQASVAHRAHNIFQHYLADIFRHCRDNLSAPEPASPASRRRRVPLPARPPPGVDASLRPEPTAGSSMPMPIPQRYPAFDGQQTAMFQDGGGHSDRLQGFFSTSLPTSAGSRVMSLAEPSLPTAGESPLLARGVRLQKAGASGAPLSSLGPGFPPELEASQFQPSTGYVHDVFPPVGQAHGMSSTQFPSRPRQPTDTMLRELHQLEFESALNPVVSSQFQASFMAQIQPNFSLAPGTGAQLEGTSDRSSTEWERITADGQETHVNPRDLGKGS